MTDARFDKDRRTLLAGAAGAAGATIAGASAAEGADGAAAQVKVAATSAANPFSLAGKVAVVTGAARGIGRAAAVALARAGASVVGLDIAAPISPSLELAPATPDDLAETGRLVEAAGAEGSAKWLAVVADQRDIAAARAAATQAKERFGGVDILFANAGVQAFKPLLEMEDVDWHTTLDINLTGTANVLRAFAPLIVERGAGRIIITSSTQGQRGTKNGSVYSATKWGLIGLAKSLALELAEHKITVNALIPGLIDTPLTRRESRYAAVIGAAGAKPSGEEGRDEKTAAADMVKQTPLGVPWIAPDDVAPAVVFLASDAARMVSGTTYAVTGGVSANLQN